MKVYLAAPYASRDRLDSIFAVELRALGVEVTSTWLEEKHEINAGTVGAATALPDEDVDGRARQNIADIERSDVLVLFTSAFIGAEGGGGRHIEMGYALAKNKRVIVVGKPENVFQRLVTVERYGAWSEVVHRLTALRDLEQTVTRERAEATARSDAEARRVIEEDLYPGELGEHA